MCSPPYLPHGQVQRLCIHLYHTERERGINSVCTPDKLTFTVMIYLIHASSVPLYSLSIQTRSSTYYLDFTCFIGL